MVIASASNRGGEETTGHLSSQRRGIEYVRFVDVDSILSVCVVVEGDMISEIQKHKGYIS
jgi:hypothetical protein